MMRAMRNLVASCALLLVAVGGCGSDQGNGGPDMSMPLDLAPGPDMAVRMPDGVTCGKMTCPVGQSCCVMASGTMTTGSSCIAAGGQCSGAVLACDGPEDCSGMQLCCGTIQLTGGNPDGGTPMFNGGNAMCAATCDAQIMLGANGTPTGATTRLCQADIDCTGLSTLGGTLMLNKCCSSTMAPGLHFCAAPFAGITCP